MTEQLTLDLSRVIVFPNCWGPVYHLEDENHFTVFRDEQTGSFLSIGDAVAFSRAHGREPEVPESTRRRWADWTPEQVREYHLKCAARRADTSA